MYVRILLIDDDPDICSEIEALLQGEAIGTHIIDLKSLSKFEDASELLMRVEFDLVILDLFRGKPDEKNTDRPGEEVLEQIKSICFIPVIFFTGLIRPIEHLKSDIVRVVRKMDGLDSLRSEIINIFDSKLLFLRQQLNAYVREVMRSYFWDFIHPNWKILEGINDEVSLGYLVVRRLASSLSKEKIIDILSDPKIAADKVHPMEFYIFPAIDAKFETGDILNREKEQFVILTPSCDLVVRNGDCKAKIILLAECILLKETEEYKKYDQNKNAGNTQDLKRLIECRKSDRYFFLPQAPFIENSILDFQNVFTIGYDELSNFKKVARLDDPFAQSMLSSFIRYYNRIAFPDIDSDHILKTLK